VSKFRRLNETPIYQGFIIRVTNETFESPTGETFDRDIVHVPAAVAVVPVLDNGDVVCVRQFRPALGHDLLEIPAGMCDVEGESLVETAQRELGEEAGYRAGTIEHLCTYHGAAGFSDARLDVFLGRDLTEVASQSHGEEEAHMTVERVSLSDVPELIASQTIIDAKTIIGLLLARDRLAGR
jgi:8-oxo-dGTP pyrophosphatase MutT (NUDIX family)